MVTRMAGSTASANRGLLDDLRALSEEELQEVWFRVCRTTLRRDLARNDHTPLQRLGCAIGQVRKARQEITQRPPITHKQVETWFKNHRRQVGDLHTVSDDNFGDVVKGKFVMSDLRRWEQIARSLLYFYLVGDQFEVPSLPNSGEQEIRWARNWASRICHYFDNFFDPVNGDVASPTSLEEVINERERRTFGLRKGRVSTARIYVSSGYMGFLEEDSKVTGAGLGDATLQFLLAGGELTLICPKRPELPAFKTAAALEAKAGKQNIASRLFVQRLDPRDEKSSSDTSYWAGEYLSRSWRYALYETADAGKLNPELLFFVQHQDGHALTRFGANCPEASNFADWIRVFKDRSGPGVAPKP